MIEKRRFSNLIQEIQFRINNLDYNKIDWNFFNSEEYVRLVFDVYDKASNGFREGKVKYYANILVNYTTFNFSSDFYKENIIECISEYSLEHYIGCG